LGTIKKTSIFIFVSLFTLHSKANDAVIIVLQSPLLKEPSLNSKVLQYLRKGERVYVPNEVALTYPLPEFIETFDRVGNTVYVPSKYLKVITNSEAENNSPISIGEHDPTDYRLEESIPSTYPFSNYSYLKSSLSLTMGNNQKSPYDYQKSTSQQEYPMENGLRLLVTKRASFDKFDRFYFGLYTSISSVTNTISFNDLTNTKENRSTIKLGPSIVFDAFKNNHYRISFGTGFTYNFHKSYVAQNLLNGASEERYFNGFSLSPFVTAYFQMENVFPNVDAVLGADTFLNLPHTLKSSAPAVYAEYWPSDSINEGFLPQTSLFIGVQVKY
jgi:hypothetical protein